MHRSRENKLLDDLADLRERPRKTEHQELKKRKKSFANDAFLSVKKSRSTTMQMFAFNNSNVYA